MKINFKEYILTQYLAFDFKDIIELEAKYIFITEGLDLNIKNENKF